MGKDKAKTIFKKLAKAVVLGDTEVAEEGAQEALTEGISPYDAVIRGLAGRDENCG